VEPQSKRTLPKRALGSPGGLGRRSTTAFSSHPLARCSTHHARGLDGYLSVTHRHTPWVLFCSHNTNKATTSLCVLRAVFCPLGLLPKGWIQVPQAQQGFITCCVLTYTVPQKDF